MVDVSALKTELERNGRLILHLKVTPKSSRNELAGVLDDGTLKLKITAAPEKGKANAEICEFLARALGVGKRSVRIVRGEASALKTVEIVRQ